MRLPDKVAIITGAGNGMGAAHARRFATEGAFVVLTDVDASGGQALADELGDRTRFVRHDVSNEDDWQRVVDAAGDTFGGLDIVVNNAGVHWTKPIEDETVDGFRRAIDTNLIGTFLGIRTAIAPMRRRAGGAIDRKSVV